MADQTRLLVRETVRAVTGLAILFVLKLVLSNFGALRRIEPSILLQRGLHGGDVIGFLISLAIVVVLVRWGFSLTRLLLSPDDPVRSSLGRAARNALIVLGTLYGYQSLSTVGNSFIGPKAGWGYDLVFGLAIIAALGFLGWEIFAHSDVYFEVVRTEVQKRRRKRTGGEAIAAAGTGSARTSEARTPHESHVEAGGTARCPSCGREISAAAKFCERCGTRIENG